MQGMKIKISEVFQVFLKKKDKKNPAVNHSAGFMINFFLQIDIGRSFREEILIQLSGTNVPPIPKLCKHKKNKT